MIGSSVPSQVGQPPVRVLAAMAVLIALIALALAASYAWLVPLQTDGGWYSYPGYALSKGRDPSENLLPVDRVAREASGVRAVFGWENRSFLIVRLHAAWFTVAGTTLRSIKIFGMLQWLLVAGLVGLAVWTSARSRLAASVAALAAMSDSWLISESMADLRPDVPIAVAVCACVVAILRYVRTASRCWIVAGSAFALILPLLHTTGVLALAFCATLAGVLAVAPAPGKRLGNLELLAVVGCGLVAFLLRQVIVDTLVPTALPEAAELPFRHNLPARLREILELGGVAKLRVEAGRWSDYFLFSNAAHAGFVGVGACGLAVSVVRRGEPQQRALRLALLSGIIAAPAALFLDPHQTPSHVVPLAALLYAASGVGLAWLLDASSSKTLRWGLVCLGLLALLVKGAHVYHLMRTHIEEGISNKSVTALVADTLEPGLNRLVIAPTWTWPYVDAARSVVLIDPGSRSHLWAPADRRWQSTHAVILDRDFLERGWDQTAQAMVRCGTFRKIGSVGRSAGGGFYLEAYRVSGPCPDVGHRANTEASGNQPRGSFAVRRVSEETRWHLLHPPDRSFSRCSEAKRVAEQSSPGQGREPGVPTKVVQVVDLFRAIASATAVVR